MFVFMTMEAIVAIDNSGGIGKLGSIPWRIPGDLKLFRSLTLGHSLLVVSKTWSTLPVLDGRTLYIATRSRSTVKPRNSNEIVVDYDTILRSRWLPDFLIGGSRMYLDFLPLCTGIYVTRINSDFSCDAMFPLSILDKFVKARDVIASSNWSCSHYLRRNAS